MTSNISLNLSKYLSLSCRNYKLFLAEHITRRSNSSVNAKLRLIPIHSYMHSGSSLINLVYGNFDFFDIDHAYGYEFTFSNASPYLSLDDSTRLTQLINTCNPIIPNDDFRRRYKIVPQRHISLNDYNYYYVHTDKHISDFGYIVLSKEPFNPCTNLVKTTTVRISVTQEVDE